MLSSKTIKSLSAALGLVAMLGTCICASESKETFGGFPKGFLFPTTLPDRLEKSKQSTSQNNKKMEPVSIKKERKQTIPPNFGGLKAGFLIVTPSPNTVEKPRKKAISHSIQATTCSSCSLSSSMSLESIMHEEGPTECTIPKSLWDHPYPYTKEAREKLYQSFPLNMPEAIVPLIEKNLSNLFPPTKEGMASVCSNPNFLAYFIAFKYLFENYSLYKERAQESLNLEKTQPASFIMQIIEHRLVESYFQYMDTLQNREEQQQFKQIFITEESDYTRGEIILEKGLWSQLTNGQPKPCVRYFADSLGSIKPTYHLYFEEAPGLINFSHPITNNPDLGFQGDFDLIEFISQDHYNTAGYILDHNRRLVTAPGLVFVKRQFLKEYEFLYYNRHPAFDQMFFFEIASIFDRNQIAPQLEPFLNLIGGIERLEKDDFVFIQDPNPDTDTTVSPSIARLVLPYLYELQEATEGSIDCTSAQIGWIDGTITKLKAILVEEICAQKDGVLDEIIMNELFEEERRQESNSEYIEIKKEPIQIRTNASLKKSSEEGGKIHRKTKNTKELQKKKTRVIDSQLIQQRRKEKILARLEEEYREKVSKKKNFSSSEVRELLGEMVKDLSLLGIERTGEAHSHGSHAAIQIENKTSRKSTHLGIANRPQKRGYQAGTVKTIIKDMILKVSLIVLKETD